MRLTITKRLFNRKAFFILLSFAFISFLPYGDEVFMKVETKTLENGKYIKVNSEILFSYSTSNMITHFLYPKEYYLLNNDYGESKLYLPEKNGVIVRYGKDFASQSSFIVQFLTGNQSDFGFRDMKFQISNSYYEDSYFVSEWIPPSAYMKLFSKVKLVTENDFPVFCEFIGSENKPFQKLYFSEYFPVNYSKVPQRITQISYSDEGDSTVSLITISDITTGNGLANELKNFKIPENASLID